MSAPLPALVIGGYLGAGKTTLVNHLLRHAEGRRIAVMVNDFGEIGIDASLIESRDGDVLNLAGGCVCCAFGSDLIGALMALPDRPTRPDLVLIEASGVALPGAVARSARLVSGIEVDGIVVLADAETVRARADDRHVGDTVRAQLADADLLVLNKLDLGDEAGRPALRRWIAEAAPRAAVLEAVEAAVPPEAVFGPVDAPGPRPTGTRPGPLAAALHGSPVPMRAPAAAADVFDSASFEVDAALDLAALARALADPALGLVRAKGVLHDVDGVRRVLQAVGARVRVSPAPPTLAAAFGAPNAPDAAPAARDAAHEAAHPASAPGRLVAIGLRGRFDPRAIETLVEAARTLARPPLACEPAA